MAADISVRVGIQGEKAFRQQLQNINTQLKITDAELAKVGSEYDDATQHSKKYAEQLVIMHKQLKLLNEKQEKATRALKNATSTYGEDSKQANKWRLEIARCEAEQAKITKTIKNTQTAIAQHTAVVEDNAETLGENATAASELGTVLSGAAVLGGVREFAQMLRECAGASVEFESAITGVYKTVDGTDEELAAIKGGIKEMASEIPAGTRELAGVAEAAGQLGIACADILDFTRTMVMLGTTTNMSAEAAATALARFGNVAGTAPADYERLGSVIVALGNNLATTESEIAEMAQRLASAGTLAGLSEANIMALAAAMSSVGIEAEAGGTAMTQTLNAIATAVDSGSAKLDTMARLAGMSANEFATKWKGESVAALQAFVAGLGSLDEESESSTAILDELGMSGVRQSNMLRSLALASEELVGAINLADTAWAENIALQEEANLRYDTTESKLQLLANASERLATAYGDTLTPAVGTLAEVVAAGENRLAEMLETAPELAGAITALGAGTGTFAVGTVATTALQCKKLVTVLNALKIAAMSNPFTAIAAGLVAIGAAAATSEKGQEILARLAGTAETLAEKYGSLGEVQQRLAAAEAEQNKLAEQGYDAHTLLTEGYERANKVTAERAERCIALNSEIKELKQAESMLLAQQEELGEAAPVNLDNSIAVSTEGLEDVPQLAARAQESLVELGASLDMSSATQISGANTMQGYISGLEGEKEKVYAKTAEIAQGVLAAWNGALDIHSPSGEFAESAEWSAAGYVEGWQEKVAGIYATLKASGEEAISAFKDGTASGTAAVMAEIQQDMQAAWKAAQVNFAAGGIKFSGLQKALKNTYTAGLISEEAYYKKLKALRDKYLTEDDSEWGSITLELYNFSEKQLEEYQQAVDDFVNDYKDAMDDMADVTRDALEDIQDEYDDVAAERDKLADKLSGGELYETIRLNYSDGSSGEYFKLADWEKDIAGLREYQRVLESLQERGLSEGLFSQVLTMDVDDATRYGRELLAQTDDEWEKYNRLWEEKQQVAAEIAGGFYRDRLAALEYEYADTLREGLDNLTDISTDAGENVVAGIIMGMQGQEESLRRQMREIADTIEEELKTSLDMHSPSRRLEDLSSLAGEGLIMGMEPKVDELRRLMDEAVPTDLEMDYSRAGGYERDSNMLNALSTLFGRNTPGGDMTIIFRVDGLDFARATLPDFRRAAAESPQFAGDF